MQFTRSQIEALNAQGFHQEEPTWAANDDFACNYRGFKVGLMIPNGGILSVSISQGETAFSIPTEFDDNLPGYYDQDGHIQLAKAAIDAILGPEPVQGALFKITN